jgi:hypothetical protein
MTSNARREYASASAPDGTSSRIPVADQMTSSEDSCHADRPWSVKSSVYTG